MRTFWIADPMPPSQARSPLPWGSSEWAADSCLAEWSEFEREWTGAPQAQATPASPAKAVAARSTPLPPLLVACVVLLVIGVGTFAWSVIHTLLG